MTLETAVGHAIPAAASILAAWIAHRVKRQVSDIHVIVNSQRTMMQDQIAQLKAEIKNLKETELEGLQNHIAQLLTMTQIPPDEKTG